MERLWSRTAAFMVVTLALAALAAGCGGAPAGDGGAEPAASDVSGSAEPAAGSVEMAAAIAKEIEASPDRAAEILESHGMTPEAWQALMYEIAEDPAKAEAYAAAKSSP